MLGPALHLGLQAERAQVGGELLARGVHALLAFGPLLVEQPRDLPVALGLQEAEGQVLQLPLDLPDAQPVGQRREDLHRLAGQRRRALGAAGRMPAQRLQARGQAQQHDAQVAREGQQHLAHPFGPARGIVGIAAFGLARRALDLHQLAGVPDQARMPGAEGLGDHLLGLGEEVAGVDEVGRRLQRRAGPDGLQDLRDTHRMAQRILAGVQPLAGQQRLGEGPRTLERRVVARRRVGAGRGRGAGGGRFVEQAQDGRAGLGPDGRGGLHGACRNSRTTAICSGSTSIGAWPTPGTTCRRARGPRCVMACAVAGESRSDCSPRNSSVGQAMRS